MTMRASFAKKKNIERRSRDHFGASGTDGAGVFGVVNFEENCLEGKEGADISVVKKKQKVQKSISTRGGVKRSIMNFARNSNTRGLYF